MTTGDQFVTMNRKVGIADLKARLSEYLVELTGTVLHRAAQSTAAHLAR